MTADEIKTVQQRAQERAEATLKQRGLQYVYNPKESSRDNYLRLMTYRAMEATLAIEFMAKTKIATDPKKHIVKPIKRWGAYNDD